VVKRVAFAVPGDLATPTGGYAYDRRVIDELRGRGWQADVVDPGGGFPFPDDAQREQAMRRLSVVEQGYALIIDGLAFGAMAQEAALLGARHPLVALVHHPLALESGLAPDVAAALRDSERKALAFASRVIVTSTQTADILAGEYGVPRALILIARPGCDAAPLAIGSEDGVARLLAVGAVSPRKGYGVLLDALARLRDLPWRLTIAGAPDRNADEAARLDAIIREHDLSGKVTLAGAVSDAHLSDLYVGADAFVSASLFEGYGMALAQAVAHGLPVVATRTGAAGDLASSGSGLLVEPGSVDGLADALQRVVADTALRQQLRLGAHAARKNLPRWTETAMLFERTLETLS
jgi:glycosyltransferase involved in cell wall biosynthesis